MLLDKHDRAVMNGDIVNVQGKAYTVHHADPRSGYVQVLSCGDHPVFRTVFPSQIGAHWAQPVRNAHVHPAMMEALTSCFRF